MRDLQADIRQLPESAEAEFELLDRNGYRARGEVGWWLILWTSVVAAGLTAFRAFRLLLRPVWAGVAVTICALVLLAVLLLRSLENLE